MEIPQPGCKHGHDVIFKGRMVLKKILNFIRLIFCVSWMGRQKLGEVTRTNPFFVPPFSRMKTWGKSKAFSSALNATRAFLVALFFPCALCETSLNHDFFGLKLDEDEGT